jgi:uncharacterized membrane protein required for colicin V production
MNWVDWVFVAAVLFAFVRGYRAGFLSTIFRAIGFIGGGLGGLYLGIAYLHKYSSGVLKFFLLFVAIAIAASVGEFLFKKVAELFHNTFLFGPFKWADSLLGAAFSVLRTLIMLVVIGHLLLITPWGWAVHEIPTSKIYKQIDSYSPAVIQEITKKAKSIH